MQILLHVGAHRCATTTFQHYLRQSRADLAAAGIAVWGPRHLRRGLMDGLMQDAGAGREAARIRVTRACAGLAARGVTHLVVSDENMLGTMRANQAAGALYPQAGDRLGRLAAAFAGRPVTVMLNIRAPQTYWPSARAFLATRPVPVLAGRDVAFGRSAGTWRPVIRDIANAAPEARLIVLPFEAFAGRPDAQLRAAGIEAPPADAVPRLNAVTTGYAALPVRQLRRFRRRYRADLAWLACGADGLATLAAEV